ncbi:MAG: hypothetical protein ACTHLE_18880 [Agriterribacter sp.]
MKFFPALLIAFAQFATATAQHVDKLMIENSGALVLYADSGYKVNFTGDKFPFHKTFRCTVAKQNSDKIIEDFLYFSDSCFAYIQYDSNKKEIAKGLVCINPARKYYDTINVPDIEKDPTLSKGIMKEVVFSYSYFDKTGMWEETESPLIIRRGKYEAGKKIGIWKVGHHEKNPQYPYHSSFPKGIFKVECMESYTNGLLDVDSQPDFSMSCAWDKLKGSWTLSDNSLYMVQHAYVKHSDQSSPRFSLKFLDTSYLINAKEKTKWKLENGVIYIYYKDEIRKYRIDYLSDQELYVTPLPYEMKAKKKR